MNDLTIMCMCEIKYPSKSAFLFLEEIRTLFHITFSKVEIENAYSYSLNATFREVLKEKMEYYNKHPATSDYKTIGSEIPLHSSSEVLSQKIDLVVQKPEKLEADFHKFSLLSQNVSHFIFTQSTYFRREIRMKRLKNIFIFIFSLVTLGYIVSVISCGGFDYPNCRSE